MQEFHGRLLSYQVTEAVNAGKLDLVLEDYELAPWPVSLVYAGQEVLPTKVRAFIDFASPRLRECLHSEAEALAANGN